MNNESLMEILTTCSDCGKQLDNVLPNGTVRMQEFCYECQEYDPEEDNLTNES